MSNEKKNDLRVWFPEDSEAIKVIQRIEELQKPIWGKHCQDTCTCLKV